MPISPFPNDARLAWLDRVNIPEHKSRFRPSAEKVLAIMSILHGGVVEPGPKGSRLKYIAKSFYKISKDTKLRYLSKGVFKQVVTDSEVFSVVEGAHLWLGHAEVTETWEGICEDYCGISRQEVEWILDYCSICNPREVHMVTLTPEPRATRIRSESNEISSLDLPRVKQRLSTHVRREVRPSADHPPSRTAKVKGKSRWRRHHPGYGSRY